MKGTHPPGTKLAPTIRLLEPPPGRARCHPRYSPGAPRAKASMSGWRTPGLLLLGALLPVVGCGGHSASPHDAGAEDAATFLDGHLLPDAAPSADAWVPPPPGQWVPPIGIPTPEFGIDATAPEPPAPWDVETPGFYYVDNTHPAATDDGNPYGTPSRPRLSIPESLTAGDVVQVRGGPYVGDLQITGQGSADRPIFVSGPAAGPRPVIDGHVDLAGSYLLLERLELDGPDAGVRVRTPSDHVTVRFCEIHNAVGGPGAGLYTGRWNPEDDPAEAAHVVFYANRIHDMGDWHTTVDEDHHAVAIGHHAHHVWVVDNEMFHCSGDGVQVNAKKAYLMPTLHHVYIGRNQAWENKQTGFWIKQAEDVIVSQNRVWGMRPSGSSEGSGLGFQYGPERIWFLYNEVFDCENGIKSSTRVGDEDGVPGLGQDVYIIGNRFWNLHKSDGSGPTSDPWQYGAAIRLTDQTATKHVVANTVYDADVGLTYARGTGPLVIGNNLFAAVAGQQILVETPEAAAASTVFHCLFAPVGSIRWGDSTVLDVPGFSAAHPGQCAGCIEGAPAFADEAQGDFHLLPASPGVDQAGASDVYDRFEALYGLSIRTDAVGTPRPQGAADDIGALETTP